MNQPLPAYPNYKPAGLPWLEQVPAHWEIRRNKYLFRERDARSQTGQEELLTVSQYTGITKRADRRKHAEELLTTAASLVGYKMVDQNDLVINIMLAWNGSLGISDFNGIVSPAYCVYKPTSADAPRYFHYLFRTPLYKAMYKAVSTGVVDSRLRLYSDKFFALPALLPPLPEQQRIVEFLEGKTRQIARLLRHKRQLIKLLNEQKQALIHRAVTQGLDAEAPRKDSGVAWLGAVPAHWEVKRLKNIVKRIDQGVSPQAVGFLADGDSWGVLKSGCVNHGVFRETEHKKLADDFKIDHEIAVAAGDVLISRACGSPALVGSVGKINELNYQLILSDKLFRPVFKDFIHPDFFIYISGTRYYRDQVEQAISGAEGMANNLPLTSLKAFYFEIPPFEEQQEIVEYLDRTLRGFNETISRAQREIELIQEYRTRLIADAVTGRVDVRHLAVAASDAELLAETELELEDEESEELVEETAETHE